MKKITRKVILNTAKDSLNEIVDQLQIDQTKKTKKVIEKLAARFSVVMKNEIAKQTKKKVKSAKSYLKSQKGKKAVAIQ
jgi:hypothetical protein